MVLLAALALAFLYPNETQAQGLVGAPFDPRLETYVDHERICDSFYCYARFVARNLHIYLFGFVAILCVLISCYLERVHRILELLALCVEFVAIGYFFHFCTLSQDFNLFQLLYSATFQPLFGSIGGIYGQGTCVCFWLGPEYYAGLSSLKKAIIATSCFSLLLALAACIVRSKVLGLKQSYAETTALLLFPASFHVSSLLLYSYFCSIAVATRL